MAVTFAVLGPTAKRAPISFLPQFYGYTYFTTDLSFWLKSSVVQILATSAIFFFPY